MGALTEPSLQSLHSLKLKPFPLRLISTPAWLRMSDPLELELWMVVSHDVGAWDPNLGPLQEPHVL